MDDTAEDEGSLMMGIHRGVYGFMLAITFLNIHPIKKFWDRRLLHPICSRRPQLCIVCMLLLLVYSLFTSFFMTFPDLIPNILFWTFHTLLFYSSAGIYLWRAWLLYAHTKLTDENAQVSSPHTSMIVVPHQSNTEIVEHHEQLKQEVKFFQRNRHLMDNSVMKSVIVMLLFIAFMPLVMYTNTFPEMAGTLLSEGFREAGSRHMMRAHLIGSFMVFLIIIVLLYDVAHDKHEDDFGIHEELSSVCKLYLVNYSIVLILTEVAAPPARYILLEPLFLIFLALSLCTSTALIPLQQSYTTQQKVSQSGVARNFSLEHQYLSKTASLHQKGTIALGKLLQDGRRNLTDTERFLLASKKGYMAFFEFTKKCWALENIRFWEAELAFDGSWEMAVSIYTVFLAPASPFEINVSSATKRLYRDKVFAGIDVSDALGNRTISHALPSRPARAPAKKRKKPAAVLPEKAVKDAASSSSAAAVPITSKVQIDRSEPLGRDVFLQARAEVLRLLVFDIFTRFILVPEHTAMWNDFLSTEKRSSNKKSKTATLERY